MQCSKAFTLAVNSTPIQHCPDWSVMPWDTESTTSIGAGGVGGTYIGGSFNVGANSPLGALSFKSLANSTLPPAYFDYSGDECHCNLHVDHGKTGGDTETNMLIQVVTVPGFVPLVQFIAPTSPIGIYDLPFTIADTMGGTTKLAVTVQLQSGADPGIFTACSINALCLITNV